MAGSKRFSPVRGRVMRLTRLDGCGRPVYGEDSQVVSNGFVTVTYTANVDAGEEIRVPNANGDVCVYEPAKATFSGYGVEIAFCQVDPALFSMATGQDVILDEVTGEATGFSMNSEVDTAATAFALEVWTGVPAVECSDEGQGTFGYVLAPYLRGGVFGDFTIENGAITFTVSNAVTRTGSGWGAGPYNVVLNSSGEPAPLQGNGVVTSGDHLKVLLTEVAPPTDAPGAYPLLDPEDTALSDFTATDGTDPNEIDFEVTPAGAEEPVLWTFGDGEWDYVIGGDTSHTYAEAGSYEVTAQRGTSTVTKTVEVPAA